jgi:hypothetical protein
MTHDNTRILYDAREYIDIDKCGNQIYLKYYDNIFYSDETSTGVISANRYNFNF